MPPQGSSVTPRPELSHIWPGWSTGQPSSSLSLPIHVDTPAKGCIKDKTPLLTPHFPAQRQDNTCYLQKYKADVEIIKWEDGGQPDATIPLPYVGSAEPRCPTVEDILPAAASASLAGTSGKLSGELCSCLLVYHVDLLLCPIWLPCPGRSQFLLIHLWIQESPFILLHFSRTAHSTARHFQMPSRLSALSGREWWFSFWLPSSCPNSSFLLVIVCIDFTGNKLLIKSTTFYLRQTR